jgi:hypothetical protein
MIKAIIAVVSTIAVFASMFLGIFAAAGLCVVIWGPSVLDTALGSPPQRTHPAFITFMLVMVPAMLLGAAGGIAGIMVPLYARFGIRCSDSVAVSRFMRGYAARILRVAGDS